MTTALIKINDKEKLVLGILSEAWSNSWGEGCCVYFRGILSDYEDKVKAGAQIPIMGIKDIRRACRSLARKGLAEYVRGLMDDEGMVAGSGYSSTEKGREMHEALNPPKLL